MRGAVPTATRGQDGVGLPYIQLCAPKVVAMAVRIVMRMLRILPQVEFEEFSLYQATLIPDYRPAVW